MNRRWKILITVSIVLLLLAASLWVSMHVQPANEVELYKQQLRAKGEKLELSEVLPPPVAPQDNSVNTVNSAFEMFGFGDDRIPNAMQMVAPGKALIGWQQPDARGYNFTNSWDEFAAEIETDRPAIELLHQVLERPKLDFQLDYEKGASMLLPHLAPMKRAAMKLEAAATLDLHNGDTGAAATNILTLLALVHKDVRDEVLISHLVRMALVAIAITPTWELLQATNVPDAQLAAVQDSWHQLDFLSDAESAFEMERASSAMIIQKSLSTHVGFQETFAGAISSASGSASSGWVWPPDWDALTSSTRLAIAETMWRSSWGYSAELGMLKNNQVILETLRIMQTNRNQFYKADYDAMSSRLSSLGVTNAGDAIIRTLNIPDFRDYFGGGGLNNVVRKTLQLEAARRVVMTAIALKRFQIKHGQWPETLDKLAPEFLAEVPIDPYDGKPLKYHPNTDGTFLLYSVGEDGIDDGGDAMPAKSASSFSSSNWNWLRARDWVWPQPALPAEVQYYYEHPPK